MVDMSTPDVPKAYVVIEEEVDWDGWPIGNWQIRFVTLDKNLAEGECQRVSPYGSGYRQGRKVRWSVREVEHLEGATP